MYAAKLHESLFLYLGKSIYHFQGDPFNELFVLGHCD